MRKKEESGAQRKHEDTTNVPDAADTKDGNDPTAQFIFGLGTERRYVSLKEGELVSEKLGATEHGIDTTRQGAGDEQKVEDDEQKVCVEDLDSETKTLTTFAVGKRVRFVKRVELLDDRPWTRCSHDLECPAGSLAVITRMDEDGNIAVQMVNDEGRRLVPKVREVSPTKGSLDRGVMWVSRQLFDALELVEEEQKDNEFTANGLRIYIHKWVDVLDTNNNQWFEGQVIDLWPTSKMVLVHYKGYKDHFDIWLNMTMRSDHARIAELHEHTPRLGLMNVYPDQNVLNGHTANSRIAGLQVDCQDDHGFWYPARIAEKRDGLIRVSYYSSMNLYSVYGESTQADTPNREDGKQGTEYDSWLPVDTYRVAPLWSVTRNQSHHELSFNDPLWGGLRSGRTKCPRCFGRGSIGGPGTGYVASTGCERCKKTGWIMGQSLADHQTWLNRHGPGTLGTHPNTTPVGSRRRDRNTRLARQDQDPDIQQAILKSIMDTNQPPTARTDTSDVKELAMVLCASQGCEPKDFSKAYDMLWPQLVSENLSDTITAEDLAKRIKGVLDLGIIGIM